MPQFTDLEVKIAFTSQGCISSVKMKLVNSYEVHKVVLSYCNSKKLIIMLHSVSWFTINW